jgi:uncharacterized membrane protein
MAGAPCYVSSDKERTMAEIVSIIYPNADVAFAARQRIVELQSQFLVDLADAVVVTKDQAGKVELHQAVNLTASGAVSGGFWGSLIGLLFLNPLLGLVVGAGAGAISGHLSDYGIPDDQMREVAETFQPGTAALFVLLRKVTADKVGDELAKFGGTLLRTSLSIDDERKLREHLSAHVAATSGDVATAPALTSP